MGERVICSRITPRPDPSAQVGSPLSHLPHMLPNVFLESFNRLRTQSRLEHTRTRSNAHAKMSAIVAWLVGE